MQIPYLLVINIIVLIIFIFAFIAAETKGRIILAALLALLFILPYLFPIPAVGWACYIGKAIFGIGCYIYIRYHGFFRR